MVAHRAGQQTCARGVSEPLTAALKNKQRQIGDLETYEFPWGAAFHDDSPIWRAAPLSRERSLSMSFIVLGIFSGEHAALAAAGVPLLLPLAVRSQSLPSCPFAPVGRPFWPLPWSFADFADFCCLPGAARI